MQPETTTSNNNSTEDGDENESVQKVIAFNNIKEENENTITPDSDTEDVVDFVSKLDRLIPSEGNIL